MRQPLTQPLLPRSQARSPGRRAPAQIRAEAAGALASPCLLALSRHLLSQVPSPLPTSWIIPLPPGEARGLWGRVGSWGGRGEARAHTWSGRGRSYREPRGGCWMRQGPTVSFCLSLLSLCWSAEITAVILQLALHACWRFELTSSALPITTDNSPAPQYIVVLPTSSLQWPDNLSPHRWDPLKQRPSLSGPRSPTPSTAYRCQPRTSQTMENQVTGASLGKSRGRPRSPGGWVLDSRP